MSAHESDLAAAAADVRAAMEGLGDLAIVIVELGAAEERSLEEAARVLAALRRAQLNLEAARRTAAREASS